MSLLQPNLTLHVRVGMGGPLSLPALVTSWWYAKYRPLAQQTFLESLSRRQMGCQLLAALPAPWGFLNAGTSLYTVISCFAAGLAYTRADHLSKWLFMVITLNALLLLLAFFLFCTSGFHVHQLFFQYLRRIILRKWNSLLQTMFLKHNPYTHSRKIDDSWIALWSHTA